MRLKGLIAPAVILVAALAMAPAALSKSGSQKLRHHHRHHLRARVLTAKASGGTVTCTGVQTASVPGDLSVPQGATCTMTHTVTVGGDVIVNKGATLIDAGAVVKGNVEASTPKGIGIGGFGSQPATVGGNVTVTGASGAGPGTVTSRSNYICNTRIANNLTIDSSAAAAGPWIVGDTDEECGGGGNLIGRNLTAEFNRNRVDISDNLKGTPPYMGGISQNLTVLFNAVTTISPVVESNFIGAIATCQLGTKTDADGTPNMVGILDVGCP